MQFLFYFADSASSCTVSLLSVVVSLLDLKEITRWGYFVAAGKTSTRNKENKHKAKRISNRSGLLETRGSS